MKTFETRLVPIDKANEDWIIQGVHNDVISTCCLVTSVVNGSWWCGGFFNEDLEQPTHFLQFKINGEWTHELKMGEE